MKNETLALVAKLVAAYPNREIPAATVKVYVSHLSSVPTQLLSTAVDELIQTSVFFPTIAELRKAAAQAKLGDVPSAEEAWSEVLAEMRSTGRQYTPDFSHRAIDQAVRDVGGWRYLCNSEGLSFERTHFLKTFKDLVCRAERVVLKISEGTKNQELQDGREAIEDEEVATSRPIPVEEPKRKRCPKCQLEEPRHMNYCTWEENQEKGDDDES